MVWGAGGANGVRGMHLARLRLNGVECSGAVGLF